MGPYLVLLLAWDHTLRTPPGLAHFRSQRCPPYKSFTGSILHNNMKTTITDTQQSSKTETIPAVNLVAEFHKVPALATVSVEDFNSLGDVLLVHVGKDADLFEVAGARSGFWAVLEGELRTVKNEDDGSITPFGNMGQGDTFGEVPLLLGKATKGVAATAIEPTTVVYFREDAFWRLMFCCPKVREVVLSNMARRLQWYQSQALHREKLISLGTLAAGLMHELNNPGAAARRAASQLRENLSRLQMISLRLCSGERKTVGQMDCLRRLQEQALETDKPKPLGSLEQSDAEECLADWLEGQGIDNAWKLAPTLSAIGLDMTSSAVCAAGVPRQRPLRSLELGGSSGLEHAIGGHHRGEYLAGYRSGEGG